MNNRQCIVSIVGIIAGLIFLLNVGSCMSKEMTQVQARRMVAANLPVEMVKALKDCDHEKE